MTRLTVAAALLLALSAAPATVEDQRGRFPALEGANVAQNELLDRRKHLHHHHRQRQEGDEQYEPLTPWEKLAIMFAGAGCVCLALVCVVCTVAEGCPLNKICCKGESSTRRSIGLF